MSNFKSCSFPSVWYSEQCPGVFAGYTHWRRRIELNLRSDLIALEQWPKLAMSLLEQVRIQDLVKGGAPGAEAESCRRSEAELRERSEQFAAGVQGPLKGPGSFWVFNAQICILPHSRDSFSLIFDIYFNTKSW